MTLQSIYDPTFKIQREPPNLLAVLNTVPADYRIRSSLQFRGRSVQCWAATAEVFSAGEQVIMVQLRNEQSVAYLKASSGYPTRWPRQLATWGNPRGANIALRYFLEGSALHFTYEKGRVVSVASATRLNVACPDGVTRNLPVVYMDEAQPAYAFDPGDQCLIYSGAPGIREVIGFIDQPPKDTSHDDDLGPWFPISARSSPYGGVTFVLSATEGPYRYKIRHYVATKTFYETPEISLSSPMTWPGPFAFCHQNTADPPVPDTILGYNLDGSGNWLYSLDFGASWHTVPRPLVTPYAWFDSIGRMTDDGGNPILQYCYTTQEAVPLPLGGVGARVYLVNMQYTGGYTTTDCLFGPANEYHTAIVYRPDPAGLALFHGSYADGSGQVVDVIAPPPVLATTSAHFSLGTFRAEAANGAAGVWAEMNSYIYPSLLIYRGTAPGITTKQIVSVPAECYMIRGVLSHSVGTVDVLYQVPGPIMKIRRIQPGGTNAYWEHPLMTGEQVYCMAASGAGRGYYGMYSGGRGKILSIPQRMGA